MQYLDHNELDLATDDFFIRWVKSPDAETEAFWQAWLEAHPYKRHQVELARKLLLSVGAREVEWSRENEDRLRGQILTAVRERPSRQPPLKINRNPMRRYWQTAAIFAAIAVISSLVWLSFANRAAYQTGYGVVREVVLPDSSTVVLNANSSLEYRQAWWSGDREVRLEGEAFFTVRRTPGLTPFTVHTGQLETEVLGTAFNVKARRRQTTVVLQSGKVRVTLPETESLGPPSRTVFLEPGQLAAYTPSVGQLTKEVGVNMEAHTAWKEGVLVFDKTALGEVAERMHDFFGVQLVLPEPISRQTFSARVPLRDGSEQVLLELIGEAFQLELIRKNDTVYVREQGEQ